MDKRTQRLLHLMKEAQQKYGAEWIYLTKLTPQN